MMSLNTCILSKQLNYLVKRRAQSRIRASFCRSIATESDGKQLFTDVITAYHNFRVKTMTIKYEADLDNESRRHTASVIVFTLALCDLVRRLKPHFLVNRAFCETSTKFGT